MVYLTIDPYGIWGFLPRVLAAIIWDGSNLCLMNSFYLLVLYWIEIITMSKLLVSPTIQQMRPALFAGLVISTVAIVPLGIWTELQRTLLSLGVYYAVLVVLLIFLIGFSTYHGMRLLDVLRTNSNSLSGLQMHKAFVQRVCLCTHLSHL